MADIMAMIGRRMRELREEQRLTAAQLADRLRIDEARLLRLEGGEGTLPTKMLMRIAKALGVEPIRFFEDDEDNGADGVPDSGGGRMRMIEIGARIRQLREELGVKRSEFARHLGISEWQVDRLESGEEPPTTNTLLRVAEALAVKPIRFFEEGWKAN